MLVSLAFALALGQASAIDKARGNTPIPLTVEDEMRRDRDDKTRKSKDGKPVYLAGPGPADIAKAYPEAALKKQMKGSASIKCRIADDGTFTKCSVVDETPSKYGFGAAALQMSSLFKVALKDDQGSDVKGVSVTVTLQFNPTS
jgi:TonB family protein